MALCEIAAWLGCVWTADGGALWQGSSTGGSQCGFWKTTTVCLYYQYVTTIDTMRWTGLHTEAEIVYMSSCNQCQQFGNSFDSRPWGHVADLPFLTIRCSVSVCVRALCTLTTVYVAALTVWGGGGRHRALGKTLLCGDAAAVAAARVVLSLSLSNICTSPHGIRQSRAARRCVRQPAPQ